MNRLERDALINPGLYPFGTKPLKVLSKEEEIGAPFEDRLRSIWGWVVVRSKRFTATLSHHERAHLSTEDLVQRFVIALKERDHKWVPERGRWITFAESIMRTISIAEREKARVVVAPSNAASRLAAYRQLEEEGRLSRRQRETMLALASVLGETEPLSGPGPTDDGDDPESERVRREIIEALKELQLPMHAYVLARSFGLNGAEEWTPKQLSKETGMGLGAIRDVRLQAGSSLRSRIEERRREDQ